MSAASNQAPSAMNPAPMKSAAVKPTARKIDAHQHFWRFSPAVHDWITSSMVILRDDFGPSDLAPLLATEGIAGSIAVQAAATLEENTFLLGLADEHSQILGVVGWVDLTASPTARDRHLERFASHPKAVGIRHLVQDEPDDRFLERADFRAGVASLAAHDLVYDLLIHTRHLEVATDFVRAIPDVPMVLDHLAKPPIASGDLAEWKRGIHQIARAENLSAKISGLVTEANWQRWKPAEFRPVLDTALEAFGPTRLMLGSDWPVCLLSAGYTEVFALLESWLAELSVDERTAIEGGTAAWVYGV